MLATPRFQPTDEVVAHVTALLHRRIVRYLQRRGRLPHEEHAEHDEPESEPNYQVFYRDTSSFCTNGALNTTNGMTIAWRP